MLQAVGQCVEGSSGLSKLIILGQVKAFIQMSMSDVGQNLSYLCQGSNYQFFEHKQQGQLDDDQTTEAHDKAIGEILAIAGCSHLLEMFFLLVEFGETEVHIENA